MKSSNPVLTRGGAFTRAPAFPADPYAPPAYPPPGVGATAGWAPPYAGMPPATRTMTVDDVVQKTGLLLGIVVGVGALMWTVGGDAAVGLIGIAAIAGFVLALVNIFKREVSPPLVVAYAVCQGVVLGGVSRLYNSAFDGIVLQAVLATAAVFGGVLFAYRSGAIRATPTFRKVVVGGLFGLIGLVLLNALVGLFAGPDPLGIRGGNFGLTVLLSLGLIGFGALSFVLDFDEVERLVRAGAAERESWRASFGLVVGLVFVYLEILRLLAMLRGDD